MGLFNRSKDNRKRNGKKCKVEVPAKDAILKSSDSANTKTPPSSPDRRSQTSRRSKRSHDRAAQQQPSNKLPSEQRRHRKRLFNISNQLVQESLVGWSYKDHSTEATDTQATPPGDLAHSYTPQCLPQSLEVEPPKQRQDAIVNLTQSTCNVIDFFSGLYICGNNTAAGYEAKTSSEIKVLEDPAMDGAIAIPREISFNNWKVDAWKDEHILVSEVNEVDSLSCPPSLLERLKGKKKHEEDLPKMRVYVENPKRVPRLRSSTSADFSTLTGPTIFMK